MKTRTPSKAISKRASVSESAPTVERRRIRAMRCSDREREIARRLPALRVLAAAQPGGLGAALRRMRRAARGWTADYDPARHAALLRLAKEKAPAGERAPDTAPRGRRRT
ncbi:hypothetical protein EDC64_111149 [Aquabacter spiritensis]|uniref:Uncharacterized protein n=1 Tax=Aquabacter spiritensis TaxID=933073 RepID=A0A4R3LWQ7_9HYPH|nr:hypothetical protein EDC64_111149 [Aquabacter spiritensis]